MPATPEDVVEQIERHLKNKPTIDEVQASYQWVIHAKELTRRASPLLTAQTKISKLTMVTASLRHHLGEMEVNIRRAMRA